MEPIHRRADEDIDAMRRNRFFNRMAIAIILILIFLFSLLVIFKQRQQKKASGFTENFHPPSSFMADFQNRVPSELGWKGKQTCIVALEDADALYKSGDVEAARDVLLTLAMDEIDDCSASAWFYSGITSITLKEPMIALECFAKIDDLEAFGEDIYWYQALAFVQVYERKPGLKLKAKGALERFIDHSRDSVRITQAGHILHAMENQ